nr:MAG TPA: hypothetical protein [Caudoviricetes sp.]
MKPISDIRALGIYCISFEIFKNHNRISFIKTA